MVWEIEKIQELLDENKRLRKAYNVLMDYYNELSPESRVELDKELNKLKL